MSAPIAEERCGGEGRLDPAFTRITLSVGRTAVVYTKRPGLPAPSNDACRHCGARKVTLRELRAPGKAEIAVKPRCWGCGREQ